MSSLKAIRDEDTVATGPEIGAGGQDHTYRQIIDNQPYPICCFAADTTLTFVNPAFARALETEREQLAGKRLLDLLDEREAELLRRCLAAITPATAAQQFEQQTVGRDGLARWRLWNVCGLFDDAGRLTTFQSVCTDITRWKRAQEALRRSQHDLAAAQRIAHLGSWVWTVATGEVQWSDETFRIFGYEPGSVTPDYALFTASVHREDREGVDAALRDAIGGGRRFGKEFRIVRPDGSMRHVSAQGEVQWDANRQVWRIVGTALDITEQTEAEDALRRSKAFLDHVLDAIDDDVFVKDETHAWVVLNRAACRQIGEVRERLIGKSDFDFFPPEQAQTHWETDETVLTTGRTISYEWSAVRDGCERTYSTRKSLFVDSHTGRRYVAGVARDITAFKQVEAALFQEKERAFVTLHSIADGVIATDRDSRIEYMNPVAEALIGVARGTARGQPLTAVFRIVDEKTRTPLPDPTRQCHRSGAAVQPTQAVLLSLSGLEYAIEESVSPIRGRDGDVLGTVLVFRDVTETRRMARQLEHDAAHDALTGLVNRREFERRLERTVLSARQFGTFHVLCYFDLDHFKLVNDAAGHVAGDALLRTVRDLVGGTFRERDTFARLGGDEFGLLLDNCRVQEALGIVDIIVSEFRDFRFAWEGKTFQIGISAGLVPITGATADAAQALAQADIACYTAKELGGGQIHVYGTPDASSSSRHRQLILASGLKDALERNSFLLYAQPVFAVAAPGAAPVQHEILLRLKDVDRIVLPADFIVPAERYGLMAAIDRWVIHAAFALLAGEPAWGACAKLAINLSGNSLNDDGFIAFLRGELERFGIGAPSICFEITETAVIRNLGRAVALLEGIKLCGCTLALDDFGSGLSSFRYLKHLPVDFLKIDGSFVLEMADNPLDLHMVEAINEVGHVLGMKTIAECVEDERSLPHLAEIGVDLAQGNVLGAPAPVLPTRDFGRAAAD